MCCERGFAPLRRRVAPPLPQGEAFSKRIPQKTAGDKPPPYCEIDYFVLSTIILFKFVWDSTHPSANADTFSHKRRLADVNLPTTVLSKAKLYIFMESKLKAMKLLSKPAIQ